MRIHTKENNPFSRKKNQWILPDNFKTAATLLKDIKKNIND